MSTAKRIFLGLLFLALAPAVPRVPGDRSVPGPVFVRPVDTVVVSNKGELDFERKAEWIEKRHGAAPGVDWRHEDAKTRLALYERASSRPPVLAKEADIVWREIGSNNLSGRMHCADLDAASGYLYCASAGGNVWRADMGGNGWICLNDRLQMPDIRSLRVLASGPARRIAVCAGKGFYYSDDEGAHWSAAAGFDGPQSWGGLRALAVANDAQQTMYVLARELDYGSGNAVTTVYRSVDRGGLFAKMASFADPAYGNSDRFDIWTDIYGDGRVFLAENANVHLVQDTSVTKIASYPLSVPGTVHMTGRQSGGNTHLYALVSHDGISDIYGSDGTAANWTFRGAVADPPFLANSFECGMDFNRLFLGGINCHLSRDGGTTWNITNDWTEYYGNPAARLHADVCGVNTVRNALHPEIVLLSTDGGMYWSTDGAVTVNNISLSSLNVSQYYSIYTDRTDPGRIHAGSQDQGYQVGTGGMLPAPGDFSQLISGDYGHLTSSDGGRSVWSVYCGFAMLVRDGIVWGMGNFVCSNQLWLPPLMADPADPMKAYLGGGCTSSGGAHLYHLSYSFAHVLYEELPFDFGRGMSWPISALACSPINPAYRYVMTSDQKFYYSSDGGASWTLTSGFFGPPPNYLFGSCILPSPVQLGRVYVSGSGYSNSPVYVSHDNGQTFSPFSTGLPSTLVASIATDEAETGLFAATEVGPYACLDGTWVDISQNASPYQAYNSVEVVAGTHLVRFGSYGRGIWEYAWDEALNPVPTLTFISPTGVTGGGDGFTLTAAGSDFVTGSFVRWNATNLATTFVSATELRASVSAADIATGGQYQVSVVNPVPGGGISNAIAFPVSTLTLAASPGTVTVDAGGSAVYAVELTPQLGSFDASVSFSCTGLPRGCTASFSPASVTPGAAVATTALTVKTTAAQSSAAGATARPAGSRPLFPAAPVILAALLLLSAIRRSVSARPNRRRLAAVVMVCLVVLLAGCSATENGDDPPSTSTPAGTYQLTVQAISGGLTVSTPVTLVVN
jgi:hypothetical protein